MGVIEATFSDPKALKAKKGQKCSKIDEGGRFWGWTITQKMFRDLNLGGAEKVRSGLEGQTRPQSLDRLFKIVKWCFKILDRVHIMNLRLYHQTTNVQLLRFRWGKKGQVWPWRPLLFLWIQLTAKGHDVCIILLWGSAWLTIFRLGKGQIGFWGPTRPYLFYKILWLQFYHISVI